MDRLMTGNGSSTKRVTPFRRAAQALVVVLIQTLVLQPAAFAATWNVAQQPLFTINAVHPNAVFMLDDSWSMNDYRLPPPLLFSVPGRWPVTTNVTVKYGGGTRSVNTKNDFTLRSSVHNPLAYDPAITYRPWNDNDKPQAAQGTRPTRDQNFPPADIGGPGPAATNGRFTERDMRFRGFTNASPNSPREWVTTARGSVGGNGTYAPGSPTNDRWTWDASDPQDLRWHKTLAGPAGKAIYGAFPGDAAQAADLFTKICTGWVQEPDGFKDGPTCNTWQDRWYKPCTAWDQVPKYKNVCKPVQVPDPTSETGYRTVQDCNLEPDGFQNGACNTWGPDTYQAQWQCKAYDQVPKYKNGACNQWNALSPARFYRYEGPVPASDADLAIVGNYRLIEIDRATPGDFAVPVDPRTGDVRKRADCQTHADPANLAAGADQCTLVEEMQNFANWFTYYRHRLFAAMAVTSHAAADLKGDLSKLRLGYGRINYFANGPDPWNPGGARLNGASFPELDNDPATPTHPGALVRGVRDFSDTPGNVARQQFFDWIFSLNWVGSTPNREALDSIGNYYMRSSDYGPWSDNPGIGGGRSGDLHASCRRSFTILASDGEWTAQPTVIPNPPTQPLITDRTPDPVGAGNGTVTAALATTGPTIAGDGLYQGDTYVYNPAAEPQFSTGNGGVTQTLTDVAMYWWNRDLRPTVPNAVQKRPSYPNDAFWQNFTTFIVGYGLNASMNTDATRQAITDGLAVNWPLVDINPALITGGERINDTMRAAMATRGDFYSASDPDQMRKSIRGVFRAIAEQAFSGTGLGSTSAQLTVGTTLYRASFRTQTWTGQLEAFDAMDTAMAAKNATPAPAALWQASFPDWDKRNLVTSTGMTNAIPFDDYSKLSAVQQSEIVSAYVMDYVRGKQIGLEVGKGDPLNGNATLGFRSRDTLLGSIVSSTPLYSKAPDFGYRLNPAAGGGSSYTGYVNSSRSGRTAAVYVGANAGVFHAFDANRNPLTGGGKELFGYVPRSTYANLKELTNVEYTHRYFVDGPVVEGDVYWGGTWKTVVMGSSGAGAPGIFALDVTDPTTFSKDKVLWDITPADEPDLGKVTGNSYIGSVKYNAGGKWVAIVPNGYQSANNRAVLLIIDVQTGNTLKKIDTCKKNNGADFGAAEQGGRCDPAALNGLANVSVMYDSHRNVTGVLSGDYQGNLWRFDLSSANPADWKIATEDKSDGSGITPAPLFTAVNGLGQPQSITTAPRAATHPYGGIYVVFGTGKFFEYQDQTSAEMQSVYGIWLKPNDKHPIDKADLKQFGLTENAGPPVTRTINGVAGFSWRTSSGWYFNLVNGVGPSLGERVIANPVIDRGMLSMTSFQPTSAENPCEGGGSSYFYVIPMDASVYDIGATRVNGVVSSITRLTIEAPVSGTRATDLNKSDATDSLNSTDITRNLDGSTSLGNRVLECVKIFNQVNVQTGYLPSACGFTAPIRVWRPIR